MDEMELNVLAACQSPKISAFKSIVFLKLPVFFCHCIKDDLPNKLKMSLGPCLSVFELPVVRYPHYWYG